MIIFLVLCDKTHYIVILSQLVIFCLKKIIVQIWRVDFSLSIIINFTVFTVFQSVPRFNEQKA